MLLLYKKVYHNLVTHSHVSHAGAVALQAHVSVATDVNFRFQTRPHESLEAEVGEVPGGGRGRAVVDLHRAVHSVAAAGAESFVYRTKKTVQT